jgi:pro-sigmaK processing inhibitor BofA
MGDAFMLKKIIVLIKKVIFSFLLLYGFNIFVNSLNVVIPINIFTLGTVTTLGVPGLVSLIAMFFIAR